MIVAIDGPTASGKGTLAKGLAAARSLQHIDTGAVYRVVAFKLLEAGLSASDEESAVRYASTPDWSLIDDPRIRSADVSEATSQIATFSRVRDLLTDAVRSLLHNVDRTGAVLDGRDTGTVICPHAEVKFFVVADLGARAARRWRQLSLVDQSVRLSDVVRQIEERDARDRSRTAAPLRRATDAIEIDTSAMSIDEMIAYALNFVDAASSGATAGSG